MTINDFNDEFDNLSGKRKAEGLNVIFQTLLSNMGNHEHLIKEILYLCTLAEDEDEFGTEGMDV